MNKQKILGVMVVFLGLIFLVNGQESKTQTKTEQLPVKLTISIDKNICVGDKFIIVSRLENTSEQDIIINVRKIRQVIDEVSYGQNPEVLIENSRGTFLNFYDMNFPPKNFQVTLKSGEYYEYKYAIDTNEDAFYKSEGKYYIQIVNVQLDTEKSEGTDFFFGKLYSNKLEFEIKSCS